MPVKLRNRVSADGGGPSGSVYGERPAGMRLISVPLTAEERVTARIAAFGQLSSLARWGADATKDELQRLLPDGREQWLLTPLEQVEAPLPDEPAWRDTAQKIMRLDGRATGSLPRLHQPEAGADFLLSTKR